MLKILMLLWIVALLLKKPTNTLFCGIWAWTSDDANKFNIDKFNIQGLYNDHRGGDSCGTFVDGIRDIGLDTYKKFPSFITIQQYAETVKERTALGHARKASVGFVNSTNAQPVTIESEGEVVFSLCHNGTIFNIDELAKKYEVDPTNLTDSMILAQILYKGNYEVLNEYYGAASLIIYDREKFLETGDNVIKIFKGGSLGYTDKLEAERPLYLYEFAPKDVYIASVSEGLEAIGGDAETIQEVPINELITIKNGELEESVSIDRNNTENYKNEWQYKNWNKNKNKNNNNFNKRQYSLPSNIEKSVHSPSSVIPYSVRNEEPITIAGSIKLQYAKLRYYRGKELVNGIYHVTAKGECFAIKPTNLSAATIPMYFFNGVMMKDSVSYNSCVREFKALSQPDRVNLKGFNIIGKYSKYPIIDLHSNSAYIKHYDFSLERMIFYKGTITPYYHSKLYEIDEGTVKSIKSIIGIHSPFTNAYTGDGEAVNDKVESNKTKIASGKAVEEAIVTAETGFVREDSLYTPNETLENFSRKNMAEIEASQEVADLIDKMQKTADLLRALEGDSEKVKQMSENLSVLEDSVVNSNFSQKSLKITWK